MTAMTTMARLPDDLSGYVRLRNGKVYVGSTRVTLPSIVLAIKRGQTPGAIRVASPSWRKTPLPRTSYTYVVTVTPVPRGTSAPNSQCLAHSTYRVIPGNAAAHDAQEL